MDHIKKYKRFVEEFVMAGTQTKPGIQTPPVETPVRPALPIPDYIPDERENPLATAEDVIDRLSNLYTGSDDEEQEKIDSYFKKYNY